MTLEEQINRDYVSAMKERNEVKVSALRMLKASLKNQIIDKKLKELKDEDIISTVTKQIKQRNDSVEEYTKAGREDLASKEQSEIKILEVYRPAQLSKEAIEAKITEILSSNNVTSKTQMGQAMKLIMPELKGKADGKMINQIVNSKLS